MKKKMRSKLLIIVLFVMLGLMVIPIITKGTTNSAPTITFGKMGGEVLKQSNSFITSSNPNGYGTVNVTATDPDGDGIAYFKYSWDYYRIQPNPTILSYQEMKATRTVGIKVPQTEGLHILRICAIDQTGKQSAWKNIPYYVVNELSKVADTTAPLFDQSNPNELPRSNSEVELGKKITVRASDLESGVYYIAYAWTKTNEGSPSSSAYTRIYQPLDNKISFNAPNERGNWTLRIFAANSTYNTAKKQFIMSNIYFFNYNIVDKTAPTVILNGDAKIEVPENTEYKDLGATVTDNYDAKRVIYSEDKVDTSKRGTYTLTYKTTDSSGNQSNTVTRTVVVMGKSEIKKLTLPNKKVYQFGEKIDLTGAKIEVTSKIGEVSSIPVTKEMFKNFTTQSIGANNATFEYGGESISYPYTVNDYVKEVTLVPPTKTTYDYKEPLDLTGATVKKVMASGVNTLVENITSEMLVNKYNPTLMGKQTIRVSYAGKEVSFEVQVTDLTAPVITLNGEEKINIQIGQPYVEQNATAKDNYDKEVKVVITSNNVNTRKIGDYEVTYQAVDSYGNIAKKVRKVHVFDATIPEIKVDSNLEIRIVLGQKFNIPTAKATDGYDGDLSSKIVVTGTVDNKKIGTYEIKYNVTDSCGNKAPEVTVKVIVEDKTAPSITLNGNNPQVLEINQEYSELGATVSDNYDKTEEISFKIDATKVNTKVAGEYKVIYTATDKSGNIATIERTVLVLNKDSLHETIDKIKDLEENDYTEDSWKHLKDAMELPENSEQQVNNKKDAIENAINNLKPKALDTTEFDKTKAEIKKLVETDYTTDSWKTLKNKLKEAYNQTLQSKLDIKVTELRQTIKDLVAKEVNQAAITSIENALKELKETDYTEKSWKKVKDAIEATKQIKDLQSKFDKALAEINLSKMLEAKPIDKTALNAIKAQLEKLNQDNYTAASWKAIQDQIAVAERQTLQSKFNEEVAKIKLDTLVLLPVISNVKITSSNKNGQYAKVGDTVTIAFESNVELDVAKTVVTLNSTPITVSKVESKGKYLYQASFTMNNESAEGNIEYSIQPQGVAENAGKKVSGKTGITFDKTLPEVKFAEGIGDKTLEVKTEYKVENSDIVISDNYTATKSLVITINNTLNVNKVNSYKITYTVKDLAGNETSITRTITVKDTTVPVITLKGDALVIIEKGQEYTDAGATATDNYDGDLTSKITVNNPVDVNTAKDYTITYDVTDSNGNLAKQVTRTVRVLNKDSLHETTDKIKDLDKNDYTEDSWKNVEDAMGLPENSEKEVNDKKDAIENAINNLKPKALDTTELDKTKAEIRKLVETDYTVDSWKKLKRVLAEANTQTLQSKLDAKVTELKQAIKDLKAKEVNQEGLTSIENALKELKQTDYTEESWKKVNDTIEATKQIKDLQSKFDKALAEINLSKMLEAKPVDKTALNAIKAELKKLTKEDYTEASWKAIQDQITVAESQTLQSKFNEEVAKIKLETLVLLPVISNVQITSSNQNRQYAKVGDTVTIVFESNVELDVSKTVVTLNSTPITVSKVENEEKYLYQASFTMNNESVEGNIEYSIQSQGIAENIGQVVSEKTGITFDKTLPEVKFADGIGDKTLEVKTEYTIENSDIVVSDNYTAVEDLAISMNNPLDINKVDKYEVSYTVKDLAGNETTITRTITVQDTTLPVITLNGTNPQIMDKNTQYNEAGATATDNYDTEITVSIDTSALKTDVGGEYEVVYTAVDSNNNKAEVKRKVIVLEKDKLNNLKQQVAGLKEKNYTQESWAELQKAMERPEETQSDINSKVYYLNEAINSLVVKPLDKTHFEEVKKIIDGLTGSDYTEESWQKVQDKLAEIENVTLQSELEDKVKELEELINQLKAKEVNQEGLTSIENALKELESTDYTEESWKKVESAIEVAKQIEDLQSKFDKALADIKLDEMLEAKPVDKTALDAIKTELEKLNQEDYTQASWKAIQDQIAVVESQTLQSKFNAEVEKIDLNTLILIPVISNIQTTTSNKNNQYAKVGDTITITFESNVELDLGKTVVTLNSTPITVSKVENEEKYLYQASFTMNDGCKEGNSRYSIKAEGIAENVGQEVNGKTGITFDKIAPVVNFADGIGDKTLEVKTEYTIENSDIVISDNYTATKDLIINMNNTLNINEVNSYEITYTVKDLAGNETSIKRTIIVQDTTAPEIKLNGQNPVIIELEQEYVDAGVLVTDNYDTKISEKLVVNNPVNVEVADEYTITYNVTDSSGNSATQVTRIVRVLDKNGLHEITDSIKDKKKEDYTEDSWNSLEDALKMPETTQQEVNNKKDAIEQAINHLEAKPLDTTELEKVKEEIRKLEETDYTQESWNSLKNKLAEIKDVTLQSVLNTKVQELKDLITKLVAKEVDQSGITMIETALESYIQTDYTEESWKSVKDAIENVKQIKDLQSKFDKALENIKLDEMLKAKTIDETALNAIKAELEKLNQEDYTQASWKAIQDQIAVAESQTLQSKFNEEVGKINLNTLVLLPVPSKVESSTTNENNKYAKLGDTISITFESNVELDLTKTIVKLNGRTATILKSGENSYTASHICEEADEEKEIRYSIEPVGVLENAGNKITGKTEIIFDKTAPVINFADGIGDKTVKYGTDYKPAKADVVVTDANETTVEILTKYTADTLGEYPVSYQAKDGAGNVSESITRNIIVEDYATGIEAINPVKLVYNQNETLDLTGGMVQFVMASGTKGNTVAMEESMISGFDSTNPGKQKLTVSYNGFETSFDITILDSTKPTIILNGEAEVTVEVGTGYVEEGAEVRDNIDMGLMPEITGEVNADKLGTYEIHYNAVDTAGNKAEEVIRTVKVVDTQKPTVFLVGDNPQYIEAGNDYVELGATAMDNYDGDITSKIRANSSEVNTAVPGEYEVRYIVSDSSKNVSKVEKRTVIVQDTTAPTITLKGESKITLEVGSKYEEQGVTIQDNADKDLTPTILGTVDTTTVGTYTLTYQVMDSHNNVAEPVTRTIEVVDTTKPTITLNGDKEITLNVLEDSYEEQGATATDNYDKDIANNIKIEGTVDTSKIGTYTITYKVTDSNQNEAETVTRTVKVIDQRAPVATLNGDANVNMIAGEKFDDPKISVIDNYDQNCEIFVEGELNPNAEGKYTLTYYAKDSSGNKSNEVTRTIHVQAVPPVISFVTGDGEIELTEGTVFRKDIEITFDKGTATLTNQTTGEVTEDFKGGTLADGKYTIVATDVSGSKTTINFVVDSTPPVVHFRSGFYNESATIEFEDVNDVHSALLVSGDGVTEIKNQYDNGITINKKGAYSLFVFDQYGNYTRLDFEIQ